MTNHNKTMKILIVDDEKIKRVTLADDLRARATKSSPPPTARRPGSSCSGAASTWSSPT